MCIRDRLESELGTPLFIRTRSAWQPTEAGVVFLQAAETILAVKKDACSRIQDMADASRRTICLGLIPERGVDMFTSIYPEFHRRFPHVLIEPRECNVRTMQKLITKGEIHMAVSYTHLDVYKRQMYSSPSAFRLRTV